MTTTLVSEALEQRAIAWRRHLHANPELSFEEHETADFVARTLAEIGHVEIERPTPTSVVARLHGGRGAGPVVALRADTDALPIQEENDVPYASTRPGVMHACGHDGHTAMLLAAAEALVQRRDELAGEVRFVFQHAEERPPGGAVELVHAGVVDGVDCVIGLHLVSPLETGRVSACAGPVTAATDVFSVEIRGRGGHGAMPHTAIDPVVVAAESVTALQQIVSRETNPFDAAVVSVTMLEAGRAPNVIPETARLQGTVRTLSTESRERVRAAMERILGGVTEAHRASFTLEYEIGYDPVVNDAETCALVERAVRAELGDEALVEFEPIMGGEDFSAYGAAAPSSFVWIGSGNAELGTDWPHHHPRFDLDEAALRTGITVLVRTTLDICSA